jgi:hypothetical protein
LLPVPVPEDADSGGCEPEVEIAVWIAEVSLLARSFEFPFLPIAVALVTIETDPIVAAAETAAFSAAQY